MLSLFASANVDFNVTTEDKQEILNFQEVNSEEDSYTQDGCFC